jgi:hypothetical protein
MTVVNTVARWPGIGGLLLQRANIALAAGPQNFNIVSAGVVSPTFSAGIARIHVYNGGAANTTVVLSVTLSDGTNNVFIFPTTAAMAVPNTAAGSGVDFMIEFNVDINANQMTSTTTVAGGVTTATMDLELYATP